MLLSMPCNCAALAPRCTLVPLGVEDRALSAGFEAGARPSVVAVGRGLLDFSIFTGITLFAENSVRCLGIGSQMQNFSAVRGFYTPVLIYVQHDVRK